MTRVAPAGPHRRRTRPAGAPFRHIADPRRGGRAGEGTRLV